jgi:hypothetical protein
MSCNILDWRFRLSNSRLNDCTQYYHFRLMYKPNHWSLESSVGYDSFELLIFPCPRLQKMLDDRRSSALTLTKLVKSLHCFSYLFNDCG